MKTSSSRGWSRLLLGAFADWRSVERSAEIPPSDGTGREGMTMTGYLIITGICFAPTFAGYLAFRTGWGAAESRDGPDSRLS